MCTVQFCKWPQDGRGKVTSTPSTTNTYNIPVRGERRDIKSGIGKPEAKPSQVGQ